MDRVKRNISGTSQASYEQYHHFGSSDVHLPKSNILLLCLSSDKRQSFLLSQVSICESTTSRENLGFSKNKTDLKDTTVYLPNSYCSELQTLWSCTLAAATVLSSSSICLCCFYGWKGSSLKATFHPTYCKSSWVCPRSPQPFHQQMELQEKAAKCNKFIMWQTQGQTSIWPGWIKWKWLLHRLQVLTLCPWGKL